MTPAEIAARLTPAQKRALDALVPPGFRSLRPGHNLLSEIDFRAAGIDSAFEGADVEAMHRSGLAIAIPAEEPRVAEGGPHPEAGDLVATHRYMLTPLGAEVRAILAQEARRDG